MEQDKTKARTKTKSSEVKNRCVNIDWLEVYCLEPVESLRNADYFRSCGYMVQERPYGTRVYKEMFTLMYDDGEPFLEIRRAPHSQTKRGKIYFAPNSVHVRLCNRTCYFTACAKVLSDFLDQHGFKFERIARIDLSYDFEKFDYGDSPSEFVRRYMNGKYSKVNQCDLSAHGKDMWDGRSWNSLSWGSKRSPVFTRLYNKTLELKQVHDKPYIRQIWAHYGLVEDFIKLTKRDEHDEVYKPEIWRLEFAITSSVRKWVTFDVDEMGKKTHLSKHNTLDCYFTHDGIWQMFISLVNHYFHFKHYEDGKTKYHCEDKKLFKFDTSNQFYKVEKLATSNPLDTSLFTLETKLQKFVSNRIDPSLHKAAKIILDEIEKEKVRSQASQPYDQSEILLLQRLIARRLNNHSDNSVTVDLAEEKAFIQLSLNLFGDDDADKIDIF